MKARTCKDCLHDEMCYATHTGYSPACCDFAARDYLQWIPVTDRLPELIPCNAGTAYSEAVIVWTDGRKAMVAVWDGVDFLCAADYWEAWGENITHWMPLPMPPKEDHHAEEENEPAP